MNAPFPVSSRFIEFLVSLEESHQEREELQDSFRSVVGRDSLFLLSSFARSSLVRCVRILLLNSFSSSITALSILDARSRRANTMYQHDPASLRLSLNGPAIASQLWKYGHTYEYTHTNANARLVSVSRFGSC